MTEVVHPATPIAEKRTGVLRLVRTDLLRNSGFMIASTVITSGLGAVFWIVATRAYSTEAVGLAAALVSAMMLTASLCAFGMQATLVDRLPRRADGREAATTLTAALVGAGALAAAGATAAVLLLPLASDRFHLLADNLFYAFAFVAGAVLMTTSTVLDYTFVAERSAGKMTLRNTVFATAKVASIAVPSLLGAAGALAILGSWVGAAVPAVATAVALVPKLHRGYRPLFDGLGAELRAIVPSLPLQHVITIAGGLAPFVLPLLVAIRLSPTANAHFYTTWMVGSLFFIVSPAVSWSLFAEGRRDGVELGATIKRAALITAILLVPLVVAALLLGKYALQLFGAEYADEGRLLLTILVLSAIPDAATNLYVATLRVRRTLVPAALLNVSMATMTLTLAWVLLPPLGIAGAGWAWLAAQSAGSIAVALHVAAIRRRPRAAEVG